MPISYFRDHPLFCKSTESMLTAMREGVNSTIIHFLCCCYIVTYNNNSIKLLFLLFQERECNEWMPHIQTRFG